MAITHANFLTQVRNYTEVDSNVLSDTLIDQFIRNTELDIASKVDYDDLRKYATTSTIASQRYLSMPSDLIYLRSVQITNAGVRDFLEKRDTSFISEFNPSETEAAPKYYVIRQYIFVNLSRSIIVIWCIGRMFFLFKRPYGYVQIVFRQV